MGLARRQHRPVEIERGYLLLAEHILPGMTNVASWTGAALIHVLLSIILSDKGAMFKSGGPGAGGSAPIPLKIFEIELARAKKKTWGCPAGAAPRSFIFGLLTCYLSCT